MTTIDSAWCFAFFHCCFCCYFSMTRFFVCYFVSIRFAAISLFNASQNFFTSFICTWLDMTSFKLLVFDSLPACLLVYLRFFSVFHFSTLHKHVFWLWWFWIVNLIHTIRTALFTTLDMSCFEYVTAVIKRRHERGRNRAHMVCSVQRFTRRLHWMV